MLTLNGVEGVKARVGEQLVVSDWFAVTQEDVNAFAKVTGDEQFIHVDPERARGTPFGATIAHGYYTLALLPRFTYETLDFQGFTYGVNYGLNRVRFPAPLFVGALVRMRSTITAVDDIPGGIQVARSITLDTDRGEKPVCVAESLTRLYV